jgi:hypothetical protein
MQNNGRYVDDRDPRAIELSQVLRQMELHLQEDRLPDFRNPNGGAQKTRNLVQHLPGYTGSASRSSRQTTFRAWLREAISNFDGIETSIHSIVVMNLEVNSSQGRERPWS